MSFKCELEIVEATDVPLSKTGSTLEPLVVALFKSSGRQFHTRTAAATQNPVFSQCFVIEGVHESEVVKFAMYDREVMDTAFIGMVELLIGGPMRAVGSRWLQLADCPAKLHVVWQCCAAPLKLQLAPQDKTPPPPETVTVVPLPGEVVPKAPQEESCAASATKQQSNEQSSAQADQIGSILSRVEALEHKLQTLTDTVEGRLHDVESRIANLTTFVTTSTHHVYRPQADMPKEEPAPRNEEVLSTSAAPTVANSATLAVSAETRKALDDIMMAPTRLTPEDGDAATRNFQPVVLPEPRSKGTAIGDPSSDSHHSSSIEPSLLDRRITAATLGVNQTVRDSTGSM